MDLQLQGKTFLITGASKGLGYALAERLVEEGANVGMMARDAESLERARLQLAGSDGRVLAFAGDVKEVADLEGFVAACRERWGRLDGIVNNAGTHAAGPFEEHGDEDWERDLSLKVMAAVRLTRIALPALRESHGVALSTLATSGKAPEARSTPTSVSRAAGLALVKALSRELAPEGVRVNAIVVGVIESEQLRRFAATAGLTPEQYYERMVTEWPIPLGRVGRPAEYADLAAFLLSPRAAYIAGGAVNLDGGHCPVV